MKRPSELSYQRPLPVEITSDFSSFRLWNIKKLLGLKGRAECCNTYYENSVVSYKLAHSNPHFAVSVCGPVLTSGCSFCLPTVRVHTSLCTCSLFLLACSVFLCVHVVFGVHFPLCSFSPCVVCLSVFRRLLCAPPLAGPSVYLSVSPLALPPGL